MTTTTITIPSGELPLYYQYPGQSRPQPAYIELAEDGAVTAGWSGEIGNAMPMRVWNGRTLRWAVSPYLSGNELAELIDELRPLLEQMHAGHTVEWDGSNRVGRLTAEARQASEEIRWRCEGAEPSRAAWTAEDWIANSRLAELWPDGQSLDDAADALIGGQGAMRDALRALTRIEYERDPDAVPAHTVQALELDAYDYDRGEERA